MLLRNSAHLRINAMLDIFQLTNKTDGPIEIAIEPAAEYFQLVPGSMIVVVAERCERITMQLLLNSLVVFEEFGNRINVKIDDQLVYESSY
jgi:hypothetical protein